MFCWTVMISGGPMPNYGRVSVRLADKNFLICDEGFDDAAAGVVCRELGFVDGKKVCCSPFGSPRSSLLFINNVRCAGKEKSLLNCTHDTATCQSVNYTSVYCAVTPFNLTQRKFAITPHLFLCPP